MTNKTKTNDEKESEQIKSPTPIIPEQREKTIQKEQVGKEEIVPVEHPHQTDTPVDSSTTPKV
ncbi:hypothetical protein BH09BAC5_BH09BAC5_15670 [soil metagenome]